MEATYFETYLSALEKCTDVQGVLGKEGVIFPPKPDYGYESTPRNALTFGCMGVDGVHYAILTIDGSVRDDSPVIQICPMDFSDLYQVLGESFLNFLAHGCGVSEKAMGDVFAAERAGKPKLVPFLKTHFKMSGYLDEQRLRKLERHLELIEPKPQTP